MALNRFSPGCCSCCRCANADICILVDTTGSMGGPINEVRGILTGLQTQLGASSTCIWAAVDYKDDSDAAPFGATYSVANNGCKVWHPFATFGEMLAAVNAMIVDGGGDFPEENFAALKYVASHWTVIGGRDPSALIKRILIWFGDAPSKNGTVGGATYPTRDATIAALTAASVKVFGINFQPAGNGIDGQEQTDNLPNQASAICSATGGLLFNNAVNVAQIQTAICQALAG